MPASDPSEDGLRHRNVGHIEEKVILDEKEQDEVIDSIQKDIDRQVLVTRTAFGLICTALFSLMLFEAIGHLLSRQSYASAFAYVRSLSLLPVPPLSPARNVYEHGWGTLSLFLLCQLYLFEVCRMIGGWCCRTSSESTPSIVTSFFNSFSSLSEPSSTFPYLHRILLVVLSLVLCLVADSVPLPSLRGDAYDWANGMRLFWPWWLGALIVGARWVLEREMAGMERDVENLKNKRYRRKNV
mmetsp:Transcript_47183/g.121964  ORF Transcript_47183/g.121964 Transcript_47183/m.121964 type:complete len:241 (-) Transcript_47183:150-872(-)